MGNILSIICRGVTVAALLGIVRNLDKKLCSYRQPFDILYLAKPKDSDSMAVALQQFGANFVVTGVTSDVRSSSPVPSTADTEPVTFASPDDRLTNMWAAERAAQLAEARATCMLSQPLRLRDALGMTAGSQNGHSSLLAVQLSVMVAEKGQQHGGLWDEGSVWGIV